MLLSVFLTSFGYAQEINCYTNLNQDMNCNTIDVQVEGVVDLLHPECDPEFPLQDYYFDYTSFGCLIPTYDMDEDEDGFASGSIELTTNNDGVSLSVSLSCDNLHIYFKGNLSKIINGDKIGTRVEINQ